MISYRQGRVSVIVCLYNVGRFLEDKSLSCILNQSWRDLEIILVNDGSTDNTPALCEQLSSVDPRIVLVNKPNGGLGSARNAGLDAASGEFVWFYDVDDEAELDLVEKNVSWMRRYDADMTIFGMRVIYQDTGRSETSRFKEQLIESNAELKSVFLDELFFVPNGNGFAWNKFYRRAFIEQCGARFGWQRIQQDELFNLALYPHAERVYVSSEPLYRYYIYRDGNNRSRYIPDRISIYESIFDGILDFQKQWGLEDDRLVDYAYRRFYQGIDTSLRFNTFHKDAPSSLKWKREEVKGILSRPKVRACLEYFASDKPHDLEGKLFYRAYHSGSFRSIYFLDATFNDLRKIKRWLGKDVGR